MRKLALLAMSLMALTAIAPRTALACGDKIVDVSRGVRFQRACAVKRASIVLYVPRATSRSIRRLESSLERVGHKVTVVSDEAALESALEARSVDLVIAEIEAVPAAARLVATAPVGARVIPMVTDPSKERLATLTKEYEFVISSPGRANDHIITIDKAIKSSRSPAEASKS